MRFILLASYKAGTHRWFTEDLRHRKSFIRDAVTSYFNSHQGEIFVADGYCNQRVVKFSPNGDYITEWGVEGVDGAEGSGKKGFLVAHSITIVPASAEGTNGVEQVCVADREHAQIDCYDLNGHRLAQYGGSILKPSVYAISFSPAYK